MNFSNSRTGILFRQAQSVDQSPFEKLFEVFKELITHTSGDFDEAIDWLRELDEEYQLTDKSYTIDDFINDLLDKGYVKAEIKPDGSERSMGITAKTEKLLREYALKQIFGKLRKSGLGNHSTQHQGAGDDKSGDLSSFQFGDSLENIVLTESIKNAQIHSGIRDFKITEDDLVVEKNHHKSQMSTVLMIDISHSMILYGEDRITPAKKVAMALAEFITTRYPKDTLDVLVFGNDAQPISIKELPYLQVGPYHTNTVAGLELAMDILRKRKTSNKQIFMITDGKPTCLKIGGRYYKNSFGLDRKVVNRCINLAAQCKKLKIPITTFMIASDPYLQKFVEEFTEMNNGKAYFASLDNLGSFIFNDFESGKRKTLY
jgi:uncharacterized protein with von Willebrand factor type A (vWA) domain